VKHSVPYPDRDDKHGSARWACTQCGLFGVKDGEEGCGGKEELDAALAKVEEYFRKHPPQLVCIVGMVESADENGFTVKVDESFVVKK
jgi:hypothetical protein